MEKPAPVDDGRSPLGAAPIGPAVLVSATELARSDPETNFASTQRQVRGGKSVQWAEVLEEVVTPHESESDEESGDEEEQDMWIEVTSEGEAQEEVQVQELVDMGFTDAAVNQQLLGLFGGDVKRCVKELLRMERESADGDEEKFDQQNQVDESLEDSWGNQRCELGDEYWAAAARCFDEQDAHYDQEEEEFDDEEFERTEQRQEHQEFGGEQFDELEGEEFGVHDSNNEADEEEELLMFYDSRSFT
jgi:hypothetical protein